MATKRCLPTRFFKDADIMNVSKDGQLILVGLVLLADDEGRELAHPTTAQPGDRLPTRTDRGSISKNSWRTIWWCSTRQANTATTA